MDKQKQTSKIFWIALFSFILIIAIPSKVSWAGHELQTVPTPYRSPTPGGETIPPTVVPVDPTAAPTAANTLAPTATSGGGDGGSEQPTNTPVVNEPAPPTATAQPVLASTATPRVFPTRVKNTQSVTNLAAPTITETQPALQTQPEASPTTLPTATQTVSAARPATASLTAVAATENTAGEKSASQVSPLFCSGGLVLLVTLLSLGFLFLRR